MTTVVTAPTLHDLFAAGCDCTTSLTDAINAGYVRTQDHPTLPLRIYNYTEKAAYEGAWNPVTFICRGLIVDTTTGRIVARPFAKFFNHGQAGAATIPLDAPVQVVDKLDGSLAVLYPTGDGRHAIATRGSFTSEQALHATEVFRARYSGWIVPEEWTVLFEIVYPQNRIVCDYGNLDDLVLLGAVEIATGNVVGPDIAPVIGWPGPAARVFTAATLAEALMLPPRPNAEGVVVRDLATGAMLKIKQDDYVALHRIVTGLNARTVWQHLVDGRSLAELVEPLPDEFHPWVRNVADDITKAVEREAWRLVDEYTRIRDTMPDDWQASDRSRRGEFAARVSGPDSWAMFAILDGKDISPRLLRNAKPAPYLTPSGRTFTEDNT